MTFPFSKLFGSCVGAVHITQPFEMKLLLTPFPMLLPTAASPSPPPPILINVQSSHKTYIGPLQGFKHFMT